MQKKRNTIKTTSHRAAEDPSSSPQDVARIEQELKRFNKTYEFHTYENAGHAFFTVDRCRVHAAVDGWEKVFNWFEKYLKPT